MVGNPPLGRRVRLSTQLIPPSGSRPNYQRHSLRNTKDPTSMPMHRNAAPTPKTLGNCIKRKRWIMWDFWEWGPFWMGFQKLGRELHHTFPARDERICLVNLVWLCQSWQVVGCRPPLQYICIILSKRTIGMNWKRKTSEMHCSFVACRPPLYLHQTLLLQ